MTERHGSLECEISGVAKHHTTLHLDRFTAALVEKERKGG